MKSFLSVCLMALILFSCESPRQVNGENSLPSGIKYKIIKRDEKGQQVKAGDQLAIHFVSKVGKDTVDNSYKLGEPQILPVNPEKGLPSEVLPFLKVGDSVSISINIDSLIKKTGNPGFTQLKAKGNTMDYYVKVYGVKTKEEVQKAAIEREKKAVEEAKKAESEEAGKIETYATKSGIDFTKTASGLRYFVSLKKSDAIQAKAGDSVTVHYTGKFLDGKVFDSSVNRGEPFQFVLGTNSVIKGWDEGLALLKKGEKATLLIPSTLGYGATGAGNGLIPPFSPLVFEVELIDIKSTKK